MHRAPTNRAYSMEFTANNYCNHHHQARGALKVSANSYQPPSKLDSTTSLNSIRSVPNPIDKEAFNSNVIEKDRIIEMDTMEL